MDEQGDARVAPDAGTPVQALAEDLRAGNRRALARAITLVESTVPAHRERALALLELVGPAAGGALRIGISGVPGVGKSTFIEAFGRHLTGQGRRVAVLAVDPSSMRSGGSILGDKTRMPELSRDPRAFVRPTPAAGTLGGVARRTREAIVLVEAAGHDVVLVETVGVGQSETAVARMTDLFVLLLLPSGGDELQGIKRGIVELADLLLVNKADGELEPFAGRTAAEYRSALRMLRARSASWEVPVAVCSALTGAGIPAAWDLAQRFWSDLSGSGEIARRRAAQARDWLWSEVGESLREALRADDRVRRLLPALEARVDAGALPPTVAAARLVAAFLNRT